MNWFAVPRYEPYEPGDCHVCGPTLVKVWHVAFNSWSVPCCRCDRCLGTYYLSRSR